MEIEIKQFAPIIIPTLNRYNHLRRCVESLSNCTHADKTELIIGLDYPPSEKYEEGWKQIKEYLPTISGFKKVTVLQRECNLGAQKNWKDLMDYAFREYESVIMSEDDNEFSPLFLAYVNRGLLIYKDNPKVTAICGYNPPINMEGYHNSIYASYGCSAWGIGLWRNKIVQYDLLEIERLLKQPHVLKKVYKRSPNLVFTILNMLKTGAIWDDTCGPFYNVINDSYSIFPKISFVRNWGFDGSGLHCGKLSDQTYVNQKIFEGKVFLYDDIEIEETSYKAVSQYIRKAYNWKRKIRLLLNIIKFYIAS